MINNYTVEQKLGLRYFSGGSSGGNGMSVSLPQATPQQMLNIYNRNLSPTLSNINATAAPTAGAMANAAAGANPIYTGSGLSQLDNYAGGYANAGNQLSQMQAGNSMNLLGGAGGASAVMGAALNNYLNPAQAANNTQAANLVNSYNLNGLSPGEYNATERSLNQSNAINGNLGVGGGMNTISNAMNFGGAFNNKLAGLGNALGASQGVANGQTASINPANFAMQSGNTSGNFGLSQYNPTQANSTLTTPYSAAASLGNQVAGSASAGRTVSTSNNSSTSGGCFLTTAVCDWKGLEDNCDILTTLRHFRDTYVPKDLVAHYYAMAPAIVENIKDSELALSYVWDAILCCVRLIKGGENTAALNVYRNMVNKLSYAV